MLGFSVVQAQEFAILCLGIFGFILFTTLERKMLQEREEKFKMIRQMNQTNKDLTHSYSYIGEVNRKLDIMMDIALGFPESSQLTPKKQREFYNSIMEAVQLFGKSDEFVIRFADLRSGDVLKEVKSNSDVAINFTQKNCNPDVQIFENDQFFAIPSPKTMDNVYSCIILKKKPPQQSSSDLETMKVIAMQALLLFVLISKKEREHDGMNDKGSIA